MRSRWFISRNNWNRSIITMMSGYCNWALFPIWERIARKRWNLMCICGKQAMA
jgi:hypothetical protein